ncbi:tail fiber domain-containing protein [bacterium]|nr:tail fiber domain-containing protein [bacterium]
MCTKRSRRATSNSPAGTTSQFVNQWSGGSKWGISLDQTVSSSTQYTHINFSTNGTTVGSINANNSATTYATSSDYRLKENQQPLTGCGAFIDALKPKTWEWKTDGSKGVGFIAHEVQEISPNSVVGTKDAVDAEGKPVYQAMEYGSAEFIANIIAELQSLRARVAALEGA